MRFRDDPTSPTRGGQALTSGAPRSRPPRLLLVSMYPLDEGLWGPTVRITHLRDELAAVLDLDVIEGYRGTRRSRLWRYAVSGRLRGLDGIYVEASSFLPAESDVAFLALARGLGIPVLTYFRDAYQFFPEYYPIDSLRRWVSARAFLPAMRALAAASTRVAVPSRGLGDALFGPNADALVLPPGAPPPVAIPYAATANRLLLVGDARLDAQGAPRLIEAVGRLRAAGRSSLGLTIVARAGQDPHGPQPDWLRIERASGDEIHRLLEDVVASVIPRPRGAYNDLAVPIKLYDYLSYARPLIVTPCEEQARVVTDAGAGVIVDDDVAGMADGIDRFLALSPDARASLAASAGRAAAAASWRHRATVILQALGMGDVAPSSER